jgi:hypothetical protein
MDHIGPEIGNQTLQLSSDAKIQRHSTPGTVKTPHPYAAKPNDASVTGSKNYRRRSRKPHDAAPLRKRIQQIKRVSVHTAGNS